MRLTLASCVCVAACKRERGGHGQGGGGWGGGGGAERTGGMQTQCAALRHLLLEQPLHCTLSKAMSSSRSGGASTKAMEGFKAKGKGKARLQPLHLLQLAPAPAYGRAQRSLIGGGACGMRRGRRGDGGSGGTRHALLELCQWKLGARVALGEQVEDGQQRLCRGGELGQAQGRWRRGGRESACWLTGRC
jgi:hypothetical protein